MTDAHDPLDVVAGKINLLLRQEDTCRIEAAKLLAKARARVEAGEAGDIGWEKWCARNVQRSQRDIRRLLALANASDPIAALAAEREKTREQVARHRTPPRIASYPTGHTMSADDEDEREADAPEYEDEDEDERNADDGAQHDTGERTDTRPATHSDVIDLNQSVELIAQKLVRRLGPGMSWALVRELQAILPPMPPDDSVGQPLGRA